jgi:nitric oxide reductase subunit C
MTLSQAKHIFIWGTAFSAVIFLVLTYDSLVKMPQRTHEERLDAHVAAGKWAWQKHNCNDCHTILGIGGYYAPDVTKVMSTRDEDWMKRFLKNPHAVWPASRQMADPHLEEQEITDLIAFLTWVNGIDTNNWPPKPLVATVSQEAMPGEALFRSEGCIACHRIEGEGGTVGPDLTKVGARRDKTWIEAQIRNPRSHNPISTMPSFAKLSAKDIGDLADYLAGLR